MYTNKALPLYRNSAGQKDGAGNWKTGSPALVRNVSLDKQPYSSEMFLKTYGYSLEVSDLLFIEDAADVAVGMYFMDGGTPLEVRKVILWDSYSEVFVYALPKQS